MAVCAEPFSLIKVADSMLASTLGQKSCKIWETAVWRTTSMRHRKFEEFPRIFLELVAFCKRMETAFSSIVSKLLHECMRTTDDPSSDEVDTDSRFSLKAQAQALSVHSLNALINGMTSSWDMQLNKMSSFTNDRRVSAGSFDVKRNGEVERSTDRIMSLSCFTFAIEALEPISFEDSDSSAEVVARRSAVADDRTCGFSKLVSLISSTWAMTRRNWR